LKPVEPLPRAQWLEQDFVTFYRPRTRVVLSGQTIEAQAVARLAESSGYDVIAMAPGGVRPVAYIIDPFTAVVLLHHELDAEAAILEI
ncbi:XdhC family protein, partial [Rhizobium ruizarguesonis]